MKNEKVENGVESVDEKSKLLGWWIEKNELGWVEDEE